MAISTVDYKPLTTDPTEETGDIQQGLTASQAYRVAWADRYTFANEVLGYSRGLGDRAIPLAHPDSPNMFVRSVRIKGEGDVTLAADADFPQWDWAIVTLNFATPTIDYGQGQDPQFLNTMGQTVEEREALVWCEQEVDFTAEWYSLPKQNCKWGSGSKNGQTIDSPVRFRVPVQIINLTFTRVPILPAWVIDDFSGALNAGTFLGIPEGQVWFIGGKTNRTADTSGQIVQKASMQFKWRKEDWNKEPDENGAFQMVTRADGTTKRYEYKDFLPLLNLQREGA